MKKTTKRKTDQGWTKGDTKRKSATKPKREVRAAKAVSNIDKRSLPSDIASGVEPEPAAKKKRGKITHRVNEFKSNGAAPATRTTPVVDDDMKVPIGEAMRQAVADLGDVIVDDAVAGNQLRELATCYEGVTRAQAAFNARQDAAKTAKKSLDSATELLLEKVRMFTHPKNLPLFDQATAEKDLEAMAAAASAGPNAPTTAVPGAETATASVSDEHEPEPATDGDDAVDPFETESDLAAAEL